MQKDNKFFDDMARMATGAAGSFLELKREIEATMHNQIEKILQNMNLATREELDTALAIASKLREEQEKIKKRLDELEK